MRAFLLCGKPGAGKTTIAEQMQGCVLLSTDCWMLRLGFEGHPDHGALRAGVQALLLDLAARLERVGASVVLDWGFWTRAARVEARTRLAAAGFTPVLVYLAVAEPELRRRIASRRMEGSANYSLTEDGWTELAARFEEPDQAEIDLTLDVLLAEFCP